MAANHFNRAEIQGEVTKVELRATTKTHVLNITVKTECDITKADGSTFQKTAWHRAIVWGNKGVELEKVITVGNTVFCKGVISYDSYDGKDGIKRYTTNINCVDVVKVTDTQIPKPVQQEIPVTANDDLPF